jgi:hypothetical protein
VVGYRVYDTGNLLIGTVGTSAVPEPGSIALLGSEVLAIAGACRRKLLI